jgi:hypothetical protein
MRAFRWRGDPHDRFNGWLRQHDDAGGHDGDRCEAESWERMLRAPVLRLGPCQRRAGWRRNVIREAISSTLPPRG